MSELPLRRLKRGVGGVRPHLPGGGAPLAGGGAAAVVRQRGVGVRGHQHDPGGPPRPAAVAQRLHGRDAASQEGEPEGDLPRLLRRRVAQAEEEDVQAVDVADEVVVEEVAVGVAGELPDGHVAGGAKGVLRIKFGTHLLKEIRTKGI